MTNDFYSTHTLAPKGYVYALKNWAQDFSSHIEFYRLSEYGLCVDWSLFSTMLKLVETRNPSTTSLFASFSLSVQCLLVFRVSNYFLLIF